MWIAILIAVPIATAAILLVGLLNWLHNRKEGSSWVQRAGLMLFSSMQRKVIVWETLAAIFLLVFLVPTLFLDMRSLPMQITTIIAIVITPILVYIRIAWSETKPEVGPQLSWSDVESELERRKGEQKAK
jgi:hypothetical protein